MGYSDFLDSDGDVLKKLLDNLKQEDDAKRLKRCKNK